MESIKTVSLMLALNDQLSGEEDQLRIKGHRDSPSKMIPTRFLGGGKQTANEPSRQSRLNRLGNGQYLRKCHLSPRAALHRNGSLVN